ncbi:hypothetical protein LCR01_19400 [Companilactobacillus crustorum]|uniref:Uncharacterized protein n=3 Tax=Companilactobacillus TaxID=2767879 RepID=A0A837RG35_9LACO|nr:hypothetical protein [Companilactobacillus crustorum]KRK41894.1 hypothetical protein FD26_GL000986 [Companilactobacillus crustorum JCM 15951]KRO19793.1 hypothetical protein IV63_GL001119 [Companilactobacillus crustorum]WDT65795.1 hypothetical protein NV391_00720 [Companilactobacillus crustorum]GEO77497.1 hypothetical protein LCR01_19400 [Companilactobacillus crustorum]
MENASNKLDFRPLDKVDMAYMDAAMTFLEEYELIEYLNDTLRCEINLDKLEFNHFKEWLVLVGNPARKLSFNPKKMVSFSLGLTHFRTHGNDEPILIADLIDRLEGFGEEGMVEKLAIGMYIRPSLLLLNQIVNR